MNHDEMLAMKPEDLRQAWMTKGNPNVQEFDRNEALWEYWRRVADCEIEYSFEDLEAAFASGLPDIQQGVNRLIERMRLPLEDFPRVRMLATQLSPDSAVYVRAFLNAREALEAIKAGACLGRGTLLDDLLEKGVWWAAIESMPYLQQEERDYLIASAEQRKVFSRGWRHELRAVRQRLEKKEGQGKTRRTKKPPDGQEK
ncbi:MAG TPA: hypothetical protein PK668_17380 [Myxococcota bacterium]|nr:hypothetical protein [Myxococcota bacterium]HRY94933.1 hypothetical protein [Myxococcota bacterium]